MTKDQELVAWGAGGLLALGLIWKSDEVVAVAKDITTRGSKLTRSTLVDGVVQEMPDALAFAAAKVYGLPISTDVYSAARMVRSEGIAQGRLRLHIMYNDAEELGWSPTKITTYADISNIKGAQPHPIANGHYGEQYSKNVGGQPATRRYASYADPYRSDVDLVLQVRQERAQGIDPTMGSTRFIDKSSMGGVQPGSPTYAAKLAEWRAGGYEPIETDNGDFVMFRRV